MKRKILFIIAFVLFACVPVYSQQFGQLEPIKKGDRIMILAPHPDDESIACAGVIQEALSKGADVHILYLTNGDSNQLAFIVYEKRLTFRKGEFVHMGEVRRTEAIAAMQLLGLDETKLTFLGYPDWGTFSIFREYWKTDKPYRSFLTRATNVPYKEDPSFDNPYVGESVLEDIKNSLKKYRPNKIFVSHQFDVNYDHKAFYLFLEVALADLKKELPSPKVYTYLVHWSEWPLPRHYHPELKLEPPPVLRDHKMYWQSFPLSSERVEKKHQAILCYKSQTQSSAFYLLAFGRKNELFSTLPEIIIEDNILSLNSYQREKSNLLKKWLTEISGLYKDGFTGKDSQGFAPEGLIYSLENDFLVIHINKKEELSPSFNLRAYLFGYSYKKPFADMPKIQIITHYDKFKVFDGKKLLEGTGVIVNLKDREYTLRIPLKALGDPDFILASIKGSKKVTSVDTAAFRKLVISRPAEEKKQDGGNKKR